jgi:hypothetical protein
MAARYSRLGGYTPSELHVSMVASRYRNSMAGRLIVYCHGAGGNGFIDGADIRTDLEHHANRGFVVHAGLLGGGITWGNDVSLNAITSMLTFMNTTYGANISRVLFVADSHGASLALNWAVRNQAQFGGAILRVPAFSLKTIHDTNIASLAAGMETAYTNLAGLVAAYPTRDACHPTFMANVVSLGLVPRLRVMYNVLDPIINPVDVLIFRDGTGVETIEMGGPSHAPWGHFNILDQFNWLRSHT